MQFIRDGSELQNVPVVPLYNVICLPKIVRTVPILLIHTACCTTNSKNECTNELKKNLRSEVTQCHLTEKKMFYLNVDLAE